MEQLTIGIIGTGRMGTVIHSLFARQPQWPIKQASTTKPIDHQRIFPLADILTCDIVVLAVPISSLPEVLHNITPLVRDNHPLILDICSVKMQPKQWMEEILPDTVDCVASHPIFGPNSTKNGTSFDCLPWIFAPIRVKQQKRFALLLQFLQQQGIATREMTAEEHDKIMSQSQAVSFLLGVVGQELQWKAGPFDTKGFSLLLENQRIVASDSRQLAQDILRLNPFAREMVLKVEHTLQKLETELEKQNRDMLL